MARNESYTFVNPLSNMWNTEIYIHSADQISDFGDLSPLNLGEAVFSPAKRLQRLIIGSSEAGYEIRNYSRLAFISQLFVLFYFWHNSYVYSSVGIFGNSDSCMPYQQDAAEGGVPAEEDYGKRFLRNRSYVDWRAPAWPSQRSCCR